MKKLFLTALVAVVAIGGAIASNASKTIAPIYYHSTGQSVDCGGSTILCSTLGKLYSDPGEENQVDPGDQKYD